MAIRVDVQTPYGIPVSDAYIKIQSVSGGKEQVMIEIFYYVNQESSESGVDPVMRTYHEFVPSVAENSDNFIKQGYEHLKTLPEFAQAIDV